MKIDQNTFKATRSACTRAIAAAWIVETFFLGILLFTTIGILLGQISITLDRVPTIITLLGALFIATVSLAFTGLVIAMMANAVANIDSRNMQAHLMELRMADSNQSAPVQPVFQHTFRDPDVDLSGIRAERVT